MSDDLKNIIEAVLLAAESPVTVVRLQSLFDEGAKPEAAQIKESIEELQKDCEERGVELRKIGSGYRYQTREKYADYLRKLHSVKPPRLSRALLETLAIIAYRQPVSRGDIEEVRGVAVSAEIMQRLIEREWVKQVGVRDVPGRPALFGTTPEFLAYFNLESLKDLPSLMEQRDLGEIAGEMETPLPPEVLAALEGKEDESDEGQGEEQTDLVDSQDDESEEAGDEEVDTAASAEPDQVEDAAKAVDEESANDAEEQPDNTSGRMAIEEVADDAGDEETDTDTVTTNAIADEEAEASLVAAGTPGADQVV